MNSFIQIHVSQFNVLWSDGHPPTFCAKISHEYQRGTKTPVVLLFEGQSNFK